MCSLPNQKPNSIPFLDAKQLEQFVTKIVFIIVSHDKKSVIFKDSVDCITIKMCNVMSSLSLKFLRNTEPTRNGVKDPLELAGER